MKYLAILFAAVILSGIYGCRPVHNADYVNDTRARDEGAVVFTRAAKYHAFFGTYSIRDFVEITYCNVQRNAAGQLVMEVGIRNSGPASWRNWWKNAPEQISLKAQSNFFRAERVSSPIVYSTNRENIIIKRGTTYAYKAVCPNGEAQTAQLVLGGYNE